MYKEQEDQRKDYCVMGRYIPIQTPSDKNYDRNKAIITILEYFGREYKQTHKGIFAQRCTLYKAGRKYIDQRCGKHFKSTIDKLTYSKPKRTFFGADYREWQFHKVKAEKFFRRLYQELRKLGADQEIWMLFNKVYLDVFTSFSIDKRGSYVISYVYRADILQALNSNKYTDEEQTILAKILNTFSAYDQLYH